jgi:hypothetical protein
MIKMATRGAGIGLLIALTGSPARAQCPGRDLLHARKDATLIFSGTPTKMEPLTFVDPPVGGQVVTFAVDAVWKGDAGKTIALYDWTGVSEGLRLRLGTRYLIFAIPIRSADFRRTQEPPTELQASGCDDKTYDEAEKKGWIRELGPSGPHAQ